MPALTPDTSIISVAVLVATLPLMNGRMPVTDLSWYCTQIVIGCGPFVSAGPAKVFWCELSPTSIATRIRVLVDPDQGEDRAHQILGLRVRSAGADQASAVRVPGDVLPN